MICAYKVFNIKKTFAVLIKTLKYISYFVVFILKLYPIIDYIQKIWFINNFFFL